jgi:hypothetical protein
LKERVGGIEQRTGVPQAGEISRQHGFGIAQHGDFDRSGSGFDHIDFVCRGKGKVDDSIMDKGASIVNAYDNFLFVFEIPDLHESMHRESRMGRCESMHVVHFTA